MTESAHGESPGEERLHGRPFDQPIQAMPNGDEETLDERLQCHSYLGIKYGRRVDRVKDAMAGNRFLQGSSQRFQDPVENHAGGSAVPSSWRWRKPIIGFVRRC
jgi:hypothetical protein